MPDPDASKIEHERISVKRLGITLSGFVFLTSQVACLRSLRHKARILAWKLKCFWFRIENDARASSCSPFPISFILILAAIRSLGMLQILNLRNLFVSSKTLLHRNPEPSSTVILLTALVRFLSISNCCLDFSCNPVSIMVTEHSSCV